jgi:hypothetical protein
MAQFLRAVVPTATVGLHCGQLSGYRYSDFMLVVPTATVGLHCGEATTRATTRTCIVVPARP